MVKRLTTWLGVYEEEIKLFLWTVLLLFIVRSGGTILNNYADAVFLKRFGVEYLPIVNMLNAIATVVVMGFVAGLMQQMSGTVLLIRMFLVSGISMAVIRALVPLELGLIYPLLFMLKAQYEVLLGLLFWNMANDLFNTQQAKRLFPLITAGGVIGQILGSFGTPWFARTLLLDNLLLAYLVLSIAGAVTVFFMARIFPTFLSDGGKKTQAKQKTSMVEEFKRVWPMLKESTLVKIMVMLTFLPNIVIPIINYQFNYAVNEQFTSEDGLLEFFGYMRGALNIVSLILLLFVGKLYGRWGLPVALMFHPFNYVLAFLAFLFRFDVFSALYSRMSTQILRTSINMPATSVVYGLFPTAYRAMIRPFLRGTVVRLGLFIGSTLILISDKLFHPRYLSLVALPFVIAWLAAPFWMKRRYTDILTDLVSGDMSDIKSMEMGDIQNLFRDPSMRRKLREDFARSSPQDSLWYGQVLKSIDDSELDRLAMQKLAGEELASNKSASGQESRIALMNLLSTADTQAVSVLGNIATGSEPEEQVAAIATLSRLSPDVFGERVDIVPLVESSSVKVRAQAAAALLPSDPGRYGALIQQWTDDSDPDTRHAGVMAAGLSRDGRFVSSLSGLLQQEIDPALRSAVLDALHLIEPDNINELAAPELQHASPEVRRAAVGAIRINDKQALRLVVPLLGDHAQEVSQQARQQIIDAPYQDGKQLISALSTPRRKLREEIFKILDVLDIKDLDMVRFVRGQAEGAYRYLIEAQAAGRLGEGEQRDLLVEHLNQQGQLQIENMVRVLAAQDSTGRMRIVGRGLMSTDARQRANSQEALADLLDKSVARFIMPLVDASPVEQKIAAAKRFFKLEPFTGSDAQFIEHLLGSKHWVTRALALETAVKYRIQGIDVQRIQEAQADSDSQIVHWAAERLQAVLKQETKDEETHMEDSMAISEKILLLKRIDIFAGLSVSELSAIASVTEEVDHGPDAKVIEQGESGETLYLIISGTVAVSKKLEDGTDLELDQMTAGDYFGEMALFEDTPRSATIRTVDDSRLMFLHKQDFNEMVREYPQIALAICNALSGRIRRLHQRMGA